MKKINESELKARVNRLQEYMAEMGGGTPPIPGQAAAPTATLPPTGAGAGQGQRGVPPNQIAPGAGAQAAPKKWAPGVLGTGSKGPEVNALQKQLGIPETGVFDAATKAAVQKKQTELGVKADGAWGPASKAAMAKAPAAAPAADPNAAAAKASAGGASMALVQNREQMVPGSTGSTEEGGVTYAIDDAGTKLAKINPQTQKWEKIAAAPAPAATGSAALDGTKPGANPATTIPGGPQTAAGAPAAAPAAGAGAQTAGPAPGTVGTGAGGQLVDGSGKPVQQGSAANRPDLYAPQVGESYLPSGQKVYSEDQALARIVQLSKHGR